MVNRYFKITIRSVNIVVLNGFIRVKAWDVELEDSIQNKTLIFII